MRLFLDTSVMLSASASTTGASRELFKRAGANGWHLITTPYAIEEVIRHIPDMVVSAATDWPGLKSHILILDDVLSLAGCFPRHKRQAHSIWRHGLG
jgi:predicted nucleic acid-binding protein